MIRTTQTLTTKRVEIPSGSRVLKFTFTNDFLYNAH